MKWSTTLTHRVTSTAIMATMAILGIFLLLNKFNIYEFVQQMLFVVLRMCVIYVEVTLYQDIGLLVLSLY